MTESSTTILRRMLDERGVEHHDYDHSDERVTEWANGGRRNARYEEWNSGTVRLDASNITPEQAIAVTLGTETCHMTYNELADISRCESCGWRANGKPTNFCPNCGARCVW